jgi:hypothetical protein
MYIISKKKKPQWLIPKAIDLMYPWVSSENLCGFSLFSERFQ